MIESSKTLVGTRCRRLVVVALAAMPSATAATAVAADEATLLLRGVVPTRCEVTIGNVEGLAELSDFDLVGSQRLEESLEISCNLPLIATVQAENGGLVNEAARQNNLQGGASEVEYELSIFLPSLGDIGPFSSDSLVAGQSFDSGNTVLFDDRGRIYVDFDADGALYAGEFSDTIRIAVRPVE